MKRPAFHVPRGAALVLLATAFLLEAHALGITVSAQSTWALTQTSFTIPAIAGADISPSMIESATNKGRITIKTNKTDPTWKVTVERTTASWYSGVTVSIQRTSTHTNVTGVVGYLDVLSSPQDFFWSTAAGTDASNVYCQYKLTGLTAAMGASNSTTLTYTVLAY